MMRHGGEKSKISETAMHHVPQDAPTALQRNFPTNLRFPLPTL
jgi:hypothetical protein